MRIQDELASRLAELDASHLSIENESHQHGGYFEGKESHFKVTVVSAQFVGLRAVQRHQKIYQLAGDLLAPNRIHALAIHAYSPDEWTGQHPDSPLCAHQPK